MSKKREWLGWLFMISGMIGCGAFAVAGTIYRFNNVKLTETELLLWSLQRCWMLIPFLLSSGLGAFILMRR